MWSYGRRGDPKEQASSWHVLLQLIIWDAPSIKKNMATVHHGTVVEFIGNCFLAQEKPTVQCSRVGMV